MRTDIQKEVERVVGGKSVNVSEIDTAETANPRVKVETAHATYDLPANRFLIQLRDMPDGVGVNALRQHIEEHFQKSQ